MAIGLFPVCCLYFNTLIHLSSHSLSHHAHRHVRIPQNDDKFCLNLINDPNESQCFCVYVCMYSVYMSERVYARANIANRVFFFILFYILQLKTQGTHQNMVM